MSSPRSASEDPGRETERPEDFRSAARRPQATISQGLQGRYTEVGYDHVVLTLGQTVDLSRIPGLAAHALTMKMIRLLGLRGRWQLALDQTQWKVGAKDVNILMLAVITPRLRVPLMWSLIEGAGTSDSDARIALMRRYLALFGAASVELLLADREFVGVRWLGFLNENSVPFVVRLKESRRHHRGRPRPAPRFAVAHLPEKRVRPRVDARTSP